MASGAGGDAVLNLRAVWDGKQVKDAKRDLDALTGSTGTSTTAIDKNKTVWDKAAAAVERVTVKKKQLIGIVGQMGASLNQETASFGGLTTAVGASIANLGPWGLALGGAVIMLGSFIDQQDKAAKVAYDAYNAFMAETTSIKELAAAISSVPSMEQAGNIAKGIIEAARKGGESEWQKEQRYMDTYLDAAKKEYPQYTEETATKIAALWTANAIEKERIDDAYGKESAKALRGVANNTAVGYVELKSKHQEVMDAIDKRTNESIVNAIKEDKVGVVTTGTAKISGGGGGGGAVAPKKPWEQTEEQRYQEWQLQLEAPGLYTGIEKKPTKPVIPGLGDGKGNKQFGAELATTTTTSMIQGMVAAAQSSEPKQAFKDMFASVFNTVLNSIISMGMQALNPFGLKLNTGGTYEQGSFKSFDVGGGLGDFVGSNALVLGRKNRAIIHSGEVIQNPPQIENMIRSVMSRTTAQAGTVYQTNLKTNMVMGRRDVERELDHATRKAGNRRDRGRV